ncbi:hypothetical protein BN946_scf184866.g8 [Trametes cinnabarina]|uniref:Uncharacterized protein n=1 Tax=Pycnoporus cinnabarinus TaxID=5643 RepID=A0A060SKV7_PYCCI|nr:hypothetical protein BN946_scf184866.g8 [Trametes cinnabarina]
MSSSTATVFIQAAHTAQAAIPAASPTSTSPPIVEVARVASHLISIASTYILRGLSAIIRSIIVPLPFLYKPLLYLLGPVIVFAQVLLDIFIFTPYGITVTLARNVYPIYVFVGVACLCAGLIGYLARAVAAGLTYAIFSPRSRLPPKKRETTLERNYTQNGTPKTRLRKRVSIKEEQ